MIRRKEEMTVQLRENIRGGKGTLECLNLFAKEEMCGKCNLFTIFTVKPGDSIGLHPHVEDAEAYYVLEGEITVEDNGETHTLRPGDAMWTGNGGEHSVSNLTDAPAKFLAIILP